jgi:uncharacterized protein
MNVSANIWHGPRHRWLWVWAFIISCLLATSVVAQQPVPPLAGRVNDLTGTLSADQRQALESKLAAFETDKGSQLAVLLVPTTQPETIEQFGIRVAETWKLGRKGVDDGVILLVAKEDRALRIEVGYGLEGMIPDAIAKRVIEEVIVPRFKAGDFAGGVTSGVDTLIKLVSGEPLPEPSRGHGGIDAPSWMDDSFPLVIVVLIAIGGLLRALLGRLLGASVMGGIAFLGGWWLAGSLISAVVIATIVFLFTLAGGGGRGIYRGGGGGGGFGGGGGGGFSGGGGGFGGGGASGRW